MVKQIVVAYGVDVDAVSGWLGSYDGQDSPSDISRGMFAGESGVPRLLELFRRNSIAATWFWPGHSIETFPREFAQCVAAGHEIGLHGYSHENPLSMTAEQETAVLDHCIGLITENAGMRPVGYTAPWWEVSDRTIDLLLSRGVASSRRRRRTRQ
jgi:peptidoglycan/xylan/chitin deacetylase (PgdA/CDA1 family)